MAKYNTIRLDFGKAEFRRITATDIEERYLQRFIGYVEDSPVYEDCSLKRIRWSCENGEWYITAETTDSSGLLCDSVIPGASLV